MKTTFHAYRFDISKPEQDRAYTELKQNLTRLGLKCFETWGGKGSYYMPEIDGREIELETACLFNNQWNTAPIEGFSEQGYRIFDWAQDYHSRDMGMNPLIKQGHWIEQTEEMREIRRNTMKCGYCGAQEPAQKGYVFCPHCIDSQYLTEDYLPMTRMRSIDSKDGDFPELTEAEKGYLLPLYRDAQTKGTTARGKARLEKMRADIEKKYTNKTRNAKTEHDGFLWILDKGLGPNMADNCIYYDHTQRFSFGWRTPLGETQLSALLDVISEFPYPYEIKCADGRKLEAA